MSEFEYYKICLAVNVGGLHYNNNNCIFIAQDPLKCSDAQNNISLHIGQHLEENY